MTVVKFVSCFSRKIVYGRICFAFGIQNDLGETEIDF